MVEGGGRLWISFVNYSFHSLGFHPHIWSTTLGPHILIPSPFGSLDFSMWIGGGHKRLDSQQDSSQCDCHAVSRFCLQLPQYIYTQPLCLSAFSPSSFPPCLSLSLSLSPSLCRASRVRSRHVLSRFCCCSVPKFHLLLYYFCLWLWFLFGKLMRGRLLENPEASCLAYWHTRWMNSIIWVIKESIH